MRFTDWGILALHTIAGRIDSLTDDRHLTTDPPATSTGPSASGHASTVHHVESPARSA